MTLHVTGLIRTRPVSDLEASTGPAWQAGPIEAITRVQGKGGFGRMLAGCWTHAADGFLVLAHAAAIAKRST